MIQHPAALRFNITAADGLNIYRIAGTPFVPGRWIPAIFIQPIPQWVAPVAALSPVS
ncbi:hypothetical protein [Martelella alba]|uniref:hypothetical protein n=1 Tax=Martelella alba TaxID=2590451 RepID=UPI0014857E63|nr:hypothetical protein [Martelella alba]